MGLIEKILLQRMAIWVEDYNEKEILKRIEKEKNAKYRYIQRNHYYILKRTV